MFNYKEINTIWIDEKFFDDKDIMTGSSISIDRTDDIERANSIWNQANKTITDVKNHFKERDKLSQGFNSLKRVFNVLCRIWKEEFGIDGVEFPNKSKARSMIESLEYFDILRANSLNRYLELRNLIEHEDEPPPQLDICIALSDYMWSFIKSTKLLINQKCDELIFESKSNGVLIVEFKVINNNSVFIPKIYITAFIDKNFVYFLEKENSIKLYNFNIINNTEEFFNERYLDIPSISENLDLKKVLLKGEIIKDTIISDFIKRVLLSDQGGLYENDRVRHIFSRCR